MKFKVMNVDFFSILFSCGNGGAKRVRIYNIFGSIIDAYLHKHFINFLVKYKAVNDNYNNKGKFRNDKED